MQVCFRNRHQEFPLSPSNPSFDRRPHICKNKYLQQFLGSNFACRTHFQLLSWKGLLEWNPLIQNNVQQNHLLELYPFSLYPPSYQKTATKVAFINQSWIFPTLQRGQRVGVIFQKIEGINFPQIGEVIMRAICDWSWSLCL